MSYLENLDRMFAVWNSTDDTEKAQLVDAALEHNVHFVDPNHNIIGRSAFLEMVKTTQTQIPEAIYVREGEVGFQNNFCRYHWRIDREGKQVMTGFDLVEVNDTGRIVKVIGFFGELRR